MTSMPRTPDKCSRLVRTGRRWLKLFIIVFVFISATSSQTTPASAVTIIVTTTNDAIADDGYCSLREAVIAANTDAEVYSSTGECDAGGSPLDQIGIPAGNYDLIICGSGEDNAATGDLDLTDNVELVGAGYLTTKIRTKCSDRVFHVDPAGTGTGVGFEDLTIEEGADISGCSGVLVEHPGGAGFDTVRLQNNDGDAICTTGQLIVTGSILSNNDGAGISISSESAGLVSVSVSNSEFSSNDAGIVGSDTSLGVTTSDFSNHTTIGIDLADSELTFTNSSVTDTQLGSGFSLVYTGGTIRASLIAGNHGAEGGGIFALNGSSEALNIVNSTISGNIATEYGGGIKATGSGEYGLYNVTISGNVANSDGDDSGLGGGIFRSPGQSIIVANSIIAHNSDFSPITQNPDCYGEIHSLGYILLGALQPNCWFTGDMTGVEYGSVAMQLDPGLGPLANNGGPTHTRALLVGSGAVDAGNPAGCIDHLLGPLTTDQRGFPRPVGQACDLGAFEMEKPYWLLLPLIMK